MRLLNTVTYQLTEFSLQKVPIYAILSHTWKDEEVTFSEIQDHGKASKLRGWQKLVDFCKEAARHGMQWAWMDTCCIDKTSSAELSEAINSMFRWYKEAFVCYVYLENLHDPEDQSLTANTFAGARWFLRGWTLQELLAPNNVVFYDSGWHDIGTKASLKKDIARITGIDVEVLTGETCIGDYSIARKMSWASLRETTRLEDVAYSLLGIFEVNMPLLYGEGLNAFKRLQEEIIRTSTDQSILAWSAQDSMSISVLASSPHAFRSSNRIVPIHRRPSESDLWGVLDCYPIDAPETRVAIRLKWNSDEQCSSPLESKSSSDTNTNRRLVCQCTDLRVLRNIRFDEFDVRTVALTISPLWVPPKRGLNSASWSSETEIALMEQDMGDSGCSLVHTISKTHTHRKDWHTRTVSYGFSDESDVMFWVAVEWSEKAYSLPTQIQIKISDGVDWDWKKGYDLTSGHGEEFSTDAIFEIPNHPWSVRAKVRHGVKTISSPFVQQNLWLTVAVTPRRL
ncbi:hypothetical protein H2200_002699 [Cladophialophora chaetospira]|uniref:Heterokaryon incompatibility domain-containing protein n=1 Tax=Cladophialophora chaetospira TaxID=386627 RepID=A0AA38XJD8_9EURO|nr:hypothetical protein H2200_002699 [Cladophialophora chaetospira]